MYVIIRVNIDCFQIYNNEGRRAHPLCSPAAENHEALPNLITIKLNKDLA